jgi:hypothetical protein
LKRAAIIGVVIAAACVLVGTVAIRARSRSTASATPSTNADPRADAPPQTRVRVEVLNATVVHGLARHATLLLRDHGFDVVSIGSSSERLDSVAVLDRSGHPDWAARVAAAMGGAHVEERPDTSRYVDVTVLLGTRWHPPAKPFYP